MLKISMRLDTSIKTSLTGGNVYSYSVFMIQFSMRLLKIDKKMLDCKAAWVIAIFEIILSLRENINLRFFLKYSHFMFECMLIIHELMPYVIDIQIIKKLIKCMHEGKLMGN